MVRRRQRSVPSGYYHLKNSQQQSVCGFGVGDHIRLRDEFGNVWRGQAELMPDDSIRFLFRDADGRRISGIGDAHGVVLRDERGKTWRGFID